MKPRRGGVCGQGGGGRRLVEHICHEWRGMLLSFHPSALHQHALAIYTMVLTKRKASAFM